MYGDLEKYFKNPHEGALFEEKSKDSIYKVLETVTKSSIHVFWFLEPYIIYLHYHLSDILSIFTIHARHCYHYFRADNKTAEDGWIRQIYNKMLKLKSKTHKYLLILPISRIGMSG